MLAEQTHQVYFAEYPGKKKDSTDWWAVCKIKARNRIDSPNILYQGNDTLLPILPSITNDLHNLGHGNGEIETHNIKNEIVEIDQEHNIENDEKIEESTFEFLEEEGDEQSDKNFEQYSSETDDSD